LVDLYNEKSGILDDEADTEVDLVSYAYQIWKNATDADPSLARIIPALAPVVYSTKARRPAEGEAAGVLVYLNTAEGNSALAWFNQAGQSVTESQFAILKAAACAADTPALDKQPQHHELVGQAVQYIMTEQKAVGGQLGRPSGARFKTYERLKRYAEKLQKSLVAFEAEPLLKA
jgi:hypothetical protein